MKKDAVKTSMLCLLFYSLSCLTAQASCVYTKTLTARELKIGIILEWATGQERDHNLFLIQRSDDGTNYYTLGKIEGKGHSDVESQYQFLDVTTSGKKVHYRLQEFEHSGRTHLTPAISVSRSTENKILITHIAETEIEDYFLGKLLSSENGNLNFVITNTAGVEVKEGSMNIVEGENQIAVSFEELTMGQYELKLVNEDEEEILIVNKVRPRKPAFIPAKE